MNHVLCKKYKYDVAFFLHNCYVDEGTYHGVVSVFLYSHERKLTDMTDMKGDCYVSITGNNSHHL